MMLTPGTVTSIHTPIVTDEMLLPMEALTTPASSVLLAPLENRVVLEMNILKVLAAPVICHRHQWYCRKKSHCSNRIGRMMTQDMCGPPLEHLLFRSWLKPQPQPLSQLDK